MRVKLSITAVLLLPVPAFAQQPPPFIPYTINQEAHTKIMNFLGEQPAKIAIPLIQVLGEIQQQAVREKVARDAKALSDGKVPKEARTPEQPSE